MKNLHKKLSSVILSGMIIVGGVASSGINVHAIALSNNKNEMNYDDFENYRYLESFKYEYRYDVKFLDVKKYPELKPSKPVKYKDRWEFAREVKRGSLSKYRKEKYINIQIENSYFRISFNPFYNYKDQFNYNLMRNCSEKYNFDILLKADSRSYGGMIEFYSKIRGMFGYSSKLLDKIDIDIRDINQLRLDLESGEDIFKFRDLKIGECYRVKVQYLEYIIKKSK